MTLIYGCGREGLVFIPRDQALELAAIHDALGSACTWGEFRSRIPARRYKEFLRLLDGSKPRADDAFPGYDFPFIADGDYPEWPAQEMLSWVPRKILEAPFSRIENSVLNGKFLILDPANERKIVAGFRAAGFHCRKDQDLILRASGCSEPKWKTRSIPELLKALASSNYEVRRGAIKALELRGTPVVPKLLAALKDEDQKIRSGVATALGKIRPIVRETVSALIEALKKDSERMPYAQHPGSDPLEVSLKDVVQAVCYALAAIGPEAKSAAPLLVGLWKRGTDRDRNSAGWALGHIGGDSALIVPALIEGLQDPNPNLRLRAIYSLGQIGPPAVPFLIETLKRRDFDISGVAHAFARIGNASLEALSLAQNDDDAIVRRRVVEILESLRQRG